MNAIGAAIEPYYADEAVKYPIQHLRAIVTEMKSNLNWYKQKNPDKSTTKRLQLIGELDAICRTLESCEPIEVWRTIWGKLGEARKEEFNADMALVYFPLKPELPPYHKGRQIVVDLCGYNLTPYEYDCCRGKFYASWINQQEGKP